MGAPRMTIAAGVGKAGAPIGTTEWADYVRLHSHAALRDALSSPKYFRELHDLIATRDAWRLMNKPDGTFFGSIEEFSAHPAPWGWGRPYAEIRPFIAAALSAATADTPAGPVAVDVDNTMALAEVPEPKTAPALPPGPGRGHKKATSPVGNEVSSAASGSALRLARIARDAPGDVKDLFRAGLISDRAAAALSPAKKTPEKAAVIHAAVEQANAVVRAHGAPADAKSKRALKSKVDAVVRETLAPVAPAAVAAPESAPVGLTVDAVKDWLRRTATDADRACIAAYAANLIGKRVA